MKQTTIGYLHSRLLVDVFGRPLDDRDAFLVFALFHSYRVVLRGPVLKDRKGCLVCAAITQRHAASALTALWWGTSKPGAHYTHWYWRWNGEWGSYGHAENLSPEESERFEELKLLLECHPFVSRFELED